MNNSRATEGSSALDAARARGAPALFRDYTRAAIVYWCVLVALGAVVLAGAVFSVAELPAARIWQVLGIAAVAAVVGIFPLRLPNSKVAIAAGDIFIFLTLMLYGAPAAALAAAAEAGVSAWRMSHKWTSRLASPASAAVAMIVCGSWFDWVVGWLASGAGVSGDVAVLVGILSFALGYFVVNPSLVTAVVWFKQRRAPTLADWLATFGWAGMQYVGSASIAAVLFLAFRQFGLPTLLVAVPIIAMFLTTLHLYFSKQEVAEREAAERSRRERAEAAEREAAQSAQYLRELEQSEKRFQSAFTHAAVGMALVSVDGRIVQVNDAMCQLLGRASFAVIGRSFHEFVLPSDAGRLGEELRRIAQGEGSDFELELPLCQAGGREVVASLHCGFFADARAAEACLIFQAFDVTARRLAEGRLQHMAYHDGLTNLANRSRLHEALARAIAAHRSDPTHHFSLVSLDCDRLKLLNESFGHGAGDQFVTMAAQRIRAQVGPSDVVARLAGDEFAILVEHGGRGTHHAITLVERIQAAMRAPFRIAGTEISTSATVGITFSDQGYRSPDEILRDADLARKKARAAGKGRYALFDPELHQRATERLLLESDLRRAIASDQFALAFQPIFDLGSRRRVGFEALARWQHPVRGAISPLSFIPVAEESGLIVQLTQWAIRRACLQLRAWHDRDPAASGLFVNVNISGHDLCDPKFADYVRETLEECSLRPSSLTLEITESTLMQQLEMAGGTMAKLQDLGVGLSVDDFGTGYSSLSYLSSLPISSLKIDRSFVSRLEARAGDAEIVRAVIQLGDALGKRVIAEGIETGAQLDRLARFGCIYGQGFLLSRPLTTQQVDELLDHPVLDLAPVARMVATA